MYQEPHDPKQPVVCFDESSTQLLADVREPTAARPGQPERYDTEYRRQGTRNLFMFIEPLAGYRHVVITERRTRQDFAHQMKWLVDEAYPEADTVRVVLDNLNTGFAPKSPPVPKPRPLIQNPASAAAPKRHLFQ